MYCLQWLIPVLLIPKPLNPALLNTHVMFMLLYMVSFFLERKPCSICSVIFVAAVFLICYSGFGNCILWNNMCDANRCENGWVIRGFPQIVAAIALTLRSRETTWIDFDSMFNDKLPFFLNIQNKIELWQL